MEHIKKCIDSLFSFDHGARALEAVELISGINGKNELRSKAQELREKMEG